MDGIAAIILFAQKIPPSVCMWCLGHVHVCSGCFIAGIIAGIIANLRQVVRFL
jgi:hypothetical protein